jgi:hypothetical protein
MIFDIQAISGDTILIKKESEHPTASPLVTSASSSLHLWSSKPWFCRVLLEAGRMQKIKDQNNILQLDRDQ